MHRVQSLLGTVCRCTPLHTVVPKWVNSAVQRCPIDRQDFNGHPQQTSGLHHGLTNICDNHLPWSRYHSVVNRLCLHIPSQASLRLGQSHVKTLGLPIKQVYWERTLVLKCVRIVLKEGSYRWLLQATSTQVAFHILVVSTWCTSYRCNSDLLVHLGSLYIHSGLN